MNLDKYQHAAVHATGKRVVVAAAAGSGKTTVLTARIKHMIGAMGIDPSTMVVLTFSRLAAQEMKTRLGPGLTRRLAFMGTYHAFALSLLIEFGHELKWEPDWLTLLDDAETETEERQALHDMGLMRNGKWARCKAHEWDAFKLTRYNGANPPTSIDPATMKIMETTAKVIEANLHAENALTFDILIDAANQLIASPTGAAIRARCRHLVVDEGQDSNSVNWWFMDSLAPDSFYIVGDISQSLYEFRAARPEKLMEYILNDADQVFPLPITYRFGAKIAEAANQLISHNTVKLDMQMETLPERESTLEVVTEADHDGIIATIQKRLQEGAEPKDIVVLARNHMTLERLSSALDMAKSVPYEYVGRSDHATKTADFRTIKGLLRLMTNPADKRGFMAVAGALGLYGDALWKLREQATKSGKSLMDTHGGVKLPERMEDMQPWLESHDRGSNYQPCFEYLADVQMRFAYDKPRDLLNHLQMETVQDRLNTKTDKVTLITCHGAKGLEWPHVMVVGMNDGTFPSRRAVMEGQLESERRIAYVAITRAKKSVTVFHEASLDPKNAMPSRFIGEMSSKAPANPAGESK